MLAVADTLVIRAALYQLLALGYGYPTEEHCRQVRELSEDLAEVVGESQPELAESLRALGAAWASTEPARIEVDFNRLFSGTVECAPHESAYEPDIFRRQRSLADIVGFYRAFGFDLGEASRWQADHIGVELEFCSILLQRQASAAEEGLEEPAEVCAAALSSFLDDHLGRWYRSLSHLLATTSGIEPYRSLASLTERWVRAEVSLHGLAPEPLAERPRAAEDDDEVPNCGVCPAVSVEEQP